MPHASPRPPQPRPASTAQRLAPAVCLGGYVAAFLLFGRSVGPAICHVAIAPVVAAGWAAGLRGGLIVGVTVLALNTALLNLTGLRDSWGPILSVGGVADAAIALLVGVAVGRMSDLGRRLRRELGERRAAEELLQGIVAHIPLSVFWKDRAGAVLGCNERFARDLGLAAPADVVGRTDYDMPATRAEADAFVACDRKVVETGQPLTDLEETQRRPDGSTAVLLTSKVPLRDARGAVAGVLGIYADITERKRAEEGLRQSEQALRESEARFRCLVEQAADAIFVLDLNDRVIDVNQRACDSLGYTRAELLGMSVTDFEDDPVAAQSQPARWGDSLTLEGRNRRKDGSTFPVEVRVGLFEAGGRRYQLALARDITARKLAEAELRAGREQYRLLFDGNPQPMWVCDAETLKFLAVNDAAVERYGYSRREFLGMTTRDIRPPEDTPAGGPGADGPAGRHRWKDGALRDVETTAHDLRFAGRPARLVLVRDVTEHRRLEEQLRQSQKMEAVGQLAGGIAHDFNNLLCIITGHIDLARRASAAEAAPLLVAAERAAGRAAELTAKLLGFARRSQLQLGPVGLADVSREVAVLLHRTIDPRIALEVTAAEGLWTVAADAGQMHQVLMNLCVNARDAMPKGGTLRIDLTNVTRERRPGSKVGPEAARPAAFVRLTVSDTGCGIPAELRARIFEPFFTTKPVGQGTGLGLAMVYGIVKQHHGWVECDSRPGRGTRFDVFLPRLVGAAEPAPPALTPAAPDALGGTTVLLVDDEPGLRGLGRVILARQGCRVLEAEDGEQALAAYAGRTGAIDLVVLDLTMPRLSGADTLRRLVALDSGVRVLLCSGYAAGQATDLACEQVVGFLPKPYRPVDLLLAIAEALERRPAAAPVSAAG